mgnify:CR=1 FL=1
MRVYEDPDPDESYNSRRSGPDVRSRKTSKIDNYKGNYKGSRTYKNNFDG